MALPLALFQDPGTEAYVSLLRATPEGGTVTENVYKAMVLPSFVQFPHELHYF